MDLILFAKIGRRYKTRFGNAALAEEEPVGVQMASQIQFLASRFRLDDRRRARFYVPRTLT
jgi:hypothetical protein